MPDFATNITHSSSPLKMITEFSDSAKQGIVSILQSDFEIHRDTASLRRTLSADMSSKKWLTQHGFSSMKKVASSQGFCVSIADSSSSSSSSSEGEEECCDSRKEELRREEFDFWSRIQDEEKKKQIETDKQRECDSWISILSQKSADEAKSIPLPYVHPLVKKSKSSLSEKSLQVCTESLGSETGSDGFSSYPPSEIEDEEMKQDPKPDTFSQNLDCYEWKPIKYNRKKSPPRSFPPPISSLNGCDGASVRMQSRRENGRLILEAESVPCLNNFIADRRDGRLVLSFISDQNDESINDERNEEEEEETEELKETEEDEESNEFETVMEMEKAPKLSSSVMNFHRLALMVKKPNGNSKELKSRVRKEEDESDAPIVLSQSLPPRPKQVARMIHSPAPAPAETLNAYEYYWRSKSKPSMKSDTTQKRVIFANNSMGDENQQVLVLRGNKGDYLVSLRNGCKIPRRSLLLWEPCCIATT